MEHLLGFTALLFVALVTLVICLRFPSLQFVLAFAFLVRLGAALLHFYIAPLPDGISDATSFENTAWIWASGGLSEILGEFRGANSHFYSFLISFLYLITDRSPLMIQSVSVLAGVIVVFFTWLLAKELWGKQHIALHAAWWMALFPTVVMYAALTMREVFVVLTLTCGLWLTVLWVHSGYYRYVLGALIIFSLGVFFHGGMTVSVAVLAVLLGWKELRSWFFALSNFRLHVIGSFAMIILVFGTVGLFWGGVDIPKLGGIHEIFSSERWMAVMSSKTYGTASYPDWTLPASGLDLIWAVPVRISYFLFSPFVWDISRAAHLVGLADAILYMVLVYSLWHNRSVIWSDPAARAVVLILLALIITYAVGTGNFGTGLRHRAKLVVVFVVLAAPFMSRLFSNRIFSVFNTRSCGSYISTRKSHVK